MVGRILYMLFFLLVNFFLSASEVADFNDIASNKNVTFFLSTPKSGTNVMTGCLSIITRKPISWFYWGSGILDPSSEYRNHISYNRLGLPLVSDVPLLYRTHYQFAELQQVPSQDNKLIFATRNPKELIYRKFFLQGSALDNPDAQFIEEFLDKYLKAFDVYSGWSPDTRMIVFYEDYIGHDEEMLLQMLQFMGESPAYLEDFINNKQEYVSRLLQSYTNQHIHNRGGASSKEGPQAIHYTTGASKETLQYIDEYLKVVAPDAWEGHLKRFETKDAEE